MTASRAGGGKGAPEGGGPVLTPEQRARIEKRLIEERLKAVRALRSFQSRAMRERLSRDSALDNYSDHMADQGTESMEMEKAAVFATKEGRYLHRIEDALHRLYNDPDNFGRCHATGNPIGFERLVALPHARYCIEYKRKLEGGAR